MDDLISRQAAIEALNGIINRFEQILRDIRESEVDDSVCGMCEYDGAFVGQSGDWCNECPGFEKDDCFKLSDKTRKKWTEEIIKALTPIQPANNSEIPNSSDTISRQAAIDRATKEHDFFRGAVTVSDKARRDELLNVICWLGELPPVQLEIIRCKDCKYAEYIDDVKTLWCTECGQGRTVAPNDFCSYAEMREVTT